jgi:hypothetical protein
MRFAQDEGCPMALAKRNGGVAGAEPTPARSSPPLPKREGEEFWGRLSLANVAEAIL